MPARLRPTAPLAADAILVGDPGRALLLAQELLEKPRMSNHARGLWGYSGRTPAGRELTIQATGMGGPSAAVVLADLAELGVKRAVRVGTCAGLGPRPSSATSCWSSEALAVGGSAAALRPRRRRGGRARRGPARAAAARAGPEARAAAIASFDTMPAEPSARRRRAVAADMQTVAVLARARELGIAAAAVLIVSEDGAGERSPTRRSRRRRSAPDGPPPPYSQPKVEG